jgi:hypothetical protein
VNWHKFAEELSDSFFAFVRDSGRAGTLVAEPPRVYYRGQGFLPVVQKSMSQSCSRVESVKYVTTSYMARST